MLEYNRLLKKRMKKLTRTAALLLAILCVAFLLAQTAFAKNTYLINDGDRVLIHTSYATDPTAVLGEAGLALGAEDTYTTQSGFGMSQIIVQRKQNITIYHGGRTMLVSSYGETVSALLHRLNVTLAQGDLITVPMDTVTYDGMVLTISRATQTEETYTAPIAHDVIYCYDASLKAGEQQVLTPGTDGQVLCSAIVSYVDDQEISRQITSEIVIRQPVAQIVAIGTYVDPTVDVSAPEEPVLPDMPVEGEGVITIASGEVLEVVKKLNVQATAYSCNGLPGVTFSGTPARVGAIAVDPSVIPLGTRMYIVSDDGAYIYGEAVAEDIGGGIKGNKIDLYFDTFDECRAFGVRDCTVYILG